MQLLKLYFSQGKFCHLEMKRCFNNRMLSYNRYIVGFCFGGFSILEIQQTSLCTERGYTCIIMFMHVHSFLFFSVIDCSLDNINISMYNPEVYVVDLLYFKISQEIQLHLCWLKKTDVRWELLDRKRFHYVKLLLV